VQKPADPASGSKAGRPFWQRFGWIRPASKKLAAWLDPAGFKKIGRFRPAGLRKKIWMKRSSQKKVREAKI
jgi:hypothetical protein